MAKSTKSDSPEISTAHRSGEKAESGFEAPKMTYVRPTVEKHDIVDVTAGFFGTFYGG